MKTNNEETLSRETLIHLANRGRIIKVVVKGIHRSEAPEYFSAYLESASFKTEGGLVGALNDDELEILMNIPEWFEIQVEKAVEGMI